MFYLVMRLLTPEQLNTARQNVASDPSAQRVAENIFEAAAPWLESDDQAIRDLMPDAQVPRSFVVSFLSGCPIHGGGSEDLGGYAHALTKWHHDPFNDRWKLRCKFGGETYPSNDFEAFYRSGMKDRSLLTGLYPDDGFGWRAPGSPHKQWFIGYCCHRIWEATVAGLEALTHGYLLSDDPRYAHKALVILDRIAEVYPDMDYHTQGMYTLEYSPGYTGKMFLVVQEPLNAQNLCTSVDIVWDTIPNDITFGASREVTEAKLLSGIVEAALDGIYSEIARTNYGGHQLAALVAAIVSGDDDKIDHAVNWTLNNTGEATTHKEMFTNFDDYIFRDKAGLAEGVEFGLHNLLLREGMGMESSSSYNIAWIGRFVQIANLVQPFGHRLWDHRKMRRMFRWPIEITCLDRFTPAIGDSGNTVGGWAELTAETLLNAYTATGDVFIGELLRRRKNRFDSFGSLLFTPPSLTPSKKGAAEIKKLTEPSRLLGGYGLALLRSGRGDQRTAVALYYGRAATEHGHFDRLNLELFGYGRKLIPDLGYPEHAAEGERPPVWQKNTLSHATVVVDSRRQDTQAPGRLRAFCAADGVNLVEVDAPDTYHHVAEYRRTVALIELATDGRYVLDLFRVVGGDQHDYSIHGFDGDFSTEGIALSDRQAEGTLAGEDIPRGAIHDDDGLSDPWKKRRSYYTYRGGGYSYLYDVRRGQPENPWQATFLDKDSAVGLRLNLLGSDEVIVSHGDPPKTQVNPKQLTYIIQRNAGEGITSRFAVVAEPFSGKPKVLGIDRIAESDSSTKIRVQHQWGEDVISHWMDHGETCFSLARRDRDGQIVLLNLMGAGTVGLDGHVLSIQKRVSGEIISVDPESSSIEIRRDRDSQPLRRRDLIGETIRIENGRRSTAYRISSVEANHGRYRIGLDNESFCIGRFVTSGINSDGSGISTKTCLYLASQGYYRGARLVDGEHAVWLPVDDVKLSPHRPKSRRDGAIGLVGQHELTAHFKPGQIAYLYDFGPGDAIHITPRASAQRRPDGSYRVKANCRAIFNHMG